MPDSITDMAPRSGADGRRPDADAGHPAVGAETYTVDDQAQRRHRRRPGHDLRHVLHAQGQTSSSIRPATRTRGRSRGKSDQGSGSLIYSNAFQVSGNVPTSAQPRPDAAHPDAPRAGIMTDAPALTWAPMAGAAYYRVSIGNATDANQVWFGQRVQQPLRPPVPYPAMTEISERLHARPVLRLAGQGLRRNDNV